MCLRPTSVHTGSVRKEGGDVDPRGLINDGHVCVMVTLPGERDGQLSSTSSADGTHAEPAAAGLTGSSSDDGPGVRGRGGFDDGAPVASPPDK
jgi:hypothetical protein